MYEYRRYYEYMNFFYFFQQEHAKNALRRAAIGVIIIILGLFFLNGIVRLARKSYALGMEQKKKEQELAGLIKERERLEADIAYLKSAGALEREAKTRLNLKRPGEEVVIVVPKQERAHSATSVSAGEQAPLPDSVREWLLRLFAR
jgi:cell division protein FtsB